MKASSPSARTLLRMGKRSGACLKYKVNRRFVIGGYTPDSRCRILRAELDETVQRRRNLLDESYRILQRAKDKPNEKDLKEVGRSHK